MCIYAFQVKVIFQSINRNHVDYWHIILKNTERTAEFYQLHHAEVKIMSFSTDIVLEMTKQ